MIFLPEVFTASGSKFIVISNIMMNSGLGQHSVVLNLRLTEGRSVASDNHKLTLSVPQGLQGLLVSQHILS